MPSEPSNARAITTDRMIDIHFLGPQSVSPPAMMTPATINAIKHPTNINDISILPSPQTTRGTDLEVSLFAIHLPIKGTSVLSSIPPYAIHEHNLSSWGVGIPPNLSLLQSSNSLFSLQLLDGVSVLHLQYANSIESVFVPTHS